MKLIKRVLKAFVEGFALYALSNIFLLGFLFLFSVLFTGCATAPLSALEQQCVNGRYEACNVLLRAEELNLRKQAQFVQGWNQWVGTMNQVAHPQQQQQQWMVDPCSLPNSNCGY